MIVEQWLDPELAAFLTDRQASTLARWCESTGRRVRLASPERLRGHTTAWLAQVYVSGGARTGKCLIKFDPGSARGRSEAGRHNWALRSSPPAFKAQHLVGQAWDPVPLDDGAFLIFFEVAQGDLTSVSTLDGLVGTRLLPRILGRVVGSVLADWNPDADLDATTVSHLLQEHQRRYGSLDEWASRHPGLREATALGLAAGTVPNPFTLVDGRRARDVRVQKHVGRAHGDLHLGNVLVPRRPTDSGYGRFSLVDLSAFRTDAALARDPMYLLTSAAMQYLPEMGPRGRWGAITAIAQFGERDHGLVPIELLECATEVWQAGRDWAHRAGLAAEWRAEALLSLVSAALQHVEFCALPEDSWWFVLLAGQATAAFLAEVSPEETRDRGQTFTVPTVAGEIPGGESPRNHEPAPRLKLAALRTLVDCLMNIDVLREQGAWTRLVDDLPSDLVPARPVAADLRQHVAMMITHINRHGRLEPWRVLVSALEQVGDTTLAQALARVGIDLEPT